mmetsp:Transcript_11282/g.15805  ORF Transcript_11282/g.15805 Transcript_11282/m.15805 type:complete len:236 (+) Transcript_11282:412-1119(+)
MINSMISIFIKNVVMLWKHVSRHKHNSKRHALLGSLLDLLQYPIVQYFWCFRYLSFPFCCGIQHGQCHSRLIQKLLGDIAFFVNAKKSISFILKSTIGQRTKIRVQSKVWAIKFANHPFIWVSDNCECVRTLIRILIKERWWSMPKFNFPNSLPNKFSLCSQPSCLFTKLPIRSLASRAHLYSGFQVTNSPMNTNLCGCSFNSRTSCLSNVHKLQIAQLFFEIWQIAFVFLLILC